ncbi:UNVERIFIED_CONTAM: hypothetical protein GTU68_026913, partial [Idotea baltica]|nr:hypothetical protein [Idotea baltica]
MSYQSIAQIQAAFEALPSSNATARQAATERQNQLTKPPGSLGKLEELAIFMAAWQGLQKPEINKAQALVFAGNHGVCAQGVNPFPQEVTVAMVENFKNGGAAINQLCKENGADLDVISLELETPTADITEGAALTEAELLDAFKRGFNAIDKHADIVILGEMGIGNSTISAALCAGAFGGSGADWVGMGTGSDQVGIQRKADVVDRAVAINADLIKTP